MSPERQLENLRRASRLSWVPPALLMTAASLFAAGAVAGNNLLFVVGAFTGLGAAASRETAPHWRNAIRAAHRGTSSTGRVSITAYFYDGAPEYCAVVHGTPGGPWRFMFSPQHWTPKTGTYDAEIRHVEGVDWPALVITHQGILFPAFMPDKFAGGPGSLSE